LEKKIEPGFSFLPPPKRVIFKFFLLRTLMTSFIEVLCILCISVTTA